MGAILLTLCACVAKFVRACCINPLRALKGESVIFQATNHKPTTWYFPPNLTDLDSWDESFVSAPFSSLDSFKIHNIRTDMDKNNSSTRPSSSQPAGSQESTVETPQEHSPSTPIDWRNIQPCPSEIMISRAREGDLMSLVTVPDEIEEGEFDASF